MDIEQLAVDAVKNAIAKTDYGKGYINTGEKMPSWDGDIVIYNTNSKYYSKEKARKLPLQVKGLQISDFSKENIKYSVEKKDIVNYLNDGGVIFFVVYIDETGDNSKIYYKELLPIFINEKLAQAKPEDKSISIDFREFPSDKVDKINICLDFINNRKRQFSFVNESLPNFDDIKGRKNIEYTFSFSDLDGTLVNHPEKMINRDVYMYVKDKDTQITIPIASTINISSTVKQLAIPIKVNNQKYYDNYFIVNEKTSTTTKIGKLLSITTKNITGKVEVKLNIKINGTLQERIVGIKFILDAHKNKSFNVGEMSLPFVLSESDELGFEELKLESLLAYYEDIEKVLDILNVKKDLHLDKATEADYGKIDCLIKSVLNNEFITNKPDNIPLQASMKIANISVTLVCFINKENKTEYQLKNAYDKDFIVYHYDLENQENQAPAICSLNKNNFIHDDNIDYDLIVDRITNFKINPMLLTFTNKLLLEMLLAFDENKNEILYTTIEKLSQFLLEKDAFDKEVSKINHYQVQQRKRKLTSEELKEINDIQSKTENEITKIGCLILMKSYDLAEALIENLSDEIKQEITQYPIYNLLKNKEIHNN